MNVNEPISGLPGVALWFVENLFFSDLCNSYIIEFSPFLLESVVNKGIIMSTHSISIMDTYSMKLIWHILEFFNSISIINFLFNLFYLIFHFFYLTRALFVETFQKCQSWLNASFLGLCDLINKWMMTLDILLFISLFPLIWNMVLRILLSQEFRNIFKHTSNVIFLSPEVCIFMNRFF